MWLIESRFKFVNVKGKVQEDLRLRSWHVDGTSAQVREDWAYFFTKDYAPKGFVLGSLKVRVRKMRKAEEGEFQKSGKLPERF